MHRIAVIIVSYNTRALLLEALAAACDLSQGTDEAVVIDNASSDGSVEAVRGLHPDVRLITNDVNRGFAAAANQGIRATTARYVTLLNSDALVERGGLRRLADYLDAHAPVGAVAPRLVHPDGRFQPSCGERLESLVTDLFGGDLLWRTLGTRPLALTEPPDDAPRGVAWVTGACVMLRRRALDQVGTLDERFFMYQEDIDLCVRLGEAGWEIVYLPGVRATHVGEASPAPAETDVLCWKLRSRDHFVRKHWGPAAAAARRVATTLGIVLKLLILLPAELIARPATAAALRARRMRLAETLRLLLRGTWREEVL